MNKCICGSNEVEDLFKGRKWLYSEIEFKYIKCKNCGIVRCSPFPSEDILKKVYSEFYDYLWYKKKKKFKKPQAYYRVVILKNFLRKHNINKILDVGCGHGYFVNTLLKQGFDAYGYDVSQLSNSLDENRYFFGPSFEVIPEKKFDMITLWHSLEHMVEPQKILNKLSRYIGRGGYIFIAVPNFNCIGERLMRTRWVWLQQPFVHIWHFSPPNIEKLINGAGFTVEKIITRDTWDAQIFDYTLSYPISIAQRRIMSNAFVWFLLEETLRLIMVPLSYALNYIYDKYHIGSELNIILKKLN